LTRFAPTFVLIALALLGTACGERTEPVGALAQTYPVSVHGAGDRPTVVKARPERIVVLDPGPAETLLAIGAGGRLVGVPAGLATGIAKRAREVVRATGQINVDEVISLEPDLIVATPSIDELDLARAGRQSGAAVYVQPDTSILNVEQGTIDIGFLVGEAPQARRLVGRIERKVEDIERRLAAVAPVKVFVDTGFFITVPERSLLGDLVRKAKGESVAGPTPGPGPFPLADLARLNPAVYLATSDAGVTLAALRETPALRAVKAVRKRRLETVPADLVTRAGPRVAEGLEAIARALHPDAFR
jgi:iron complex transport system substrate-binding protein